MEGPAGGDHLALRDVVKDDFSTRLFLFLIERGAQWGRTSRAPAHIHTHGVELTSGERFLFFFGAEEVEFVDK
jgi:hypothetical protein